MQVRKTLTQFLTDERADTRREDAGNNKIAAFFLPEKGFAGNEGKLQFAPLEIVNAHIAHYVTRLLIRRQCWRYCHNDQLE